MKSSTLSKSVVGVAQLPSEWPNLPAVPAGVPFFSAAACPHTEAGGMLPADEQQGTNEPGRPSQGNPWHAPAVWFEPPQGNVHSGLPAQ
jgi:hypothetical protein